VQYEEEQLSYEWEIEREIDEKPRKVILSWAYDGEDDKRFRKSAALALLFTVLLSAVISQITLPPLIVNGQEMPERVVRLLMEERPTPPVETPKAKVPEKRAEKPIEPVKLAKVEPKAEPLAPVEPEAKDQGILAFRERLAASNDDQVVGRLAQPRRGRRPR
jgi:hypothetical protein